MTALDKTSEENVLKTVKYDIIKSYKLISVLSNLLSCVQFLAAL